MSKSTEDIRLMRETLRNTLGNENRKVKALEDIADALEAIRLVLDSKVMQTTGKNDKGNQRATD